MAEKDTRSALSEVITEIQFDLVKLKNDLSKEEPFPEIKESFVTIIDRLVDDAKPLYEEIEKEFKEETYE